MFGIGDGEFSVGGTVGGVVAAAVVGYDKGVAMMPVFGVRGLKFSE